MRPPATSDTSFGETYRNLVEAAIRNEEAIESAIRKMQATDEILRKRVQTLPDWVAGEVDRRLEKVVHDTVAKVTANLTAVNDATKRLQVQYENAAKFTVRRMAVACFGFACIGIIIGAFIAAWRILPPPDVLQRDRLAQQNVEKLAPRGGNAILTTCGDRLCVRTDERGQQTWGAGTETYRIVYGY